MYSILNCYGYYHIEKHDIGICGFCFKKKKVWKSMYYTTDGKKYFKNGTYACKKCIDAREWERLGKVKTIKEAKEVIKRALFVDSL